QIERKDTVAAVRTALGTGYRHIDTAQGYGNEAEVGEAIRASGLDREDVYVTSKLRNSVHAPDAAREAFEGTLSAPGCACVNLFLMHWPIPHGPVDYVETWKVFQEFKREGRARSIGVSNFQVEHLERLDPAPAVNQIELHPYFLNAEVDAYGKA